MAVKSIYKTFWNHFFIYFFLFLLTILIGVIGYTTIEGYTLLEAVYMAITTIATVGYGEVKPLGTYGRIFTILYIFVNLATLTYVITNVSRFLFDGEFIRLYKLNKMEKTIHQLKNHIIICGYGRNGKKAYSELIQNKQDVVVIDTKEMEDEISLYIKGEATHDETLLKAGILNASSIICALPNDAENVFIVLTAKELNPSIKAISRANNESSIKKLKLAGASNVIMPDSLGGAHMANLVLMPDIKEFIDYMYSSNSHSNNVVELISHKSINVGTLDCWNKTKAILLGIRRKDGEYIVNPNPEIAIYPQDRLIVLGTDEQINQLKSFCSC